MLNIKESHKEIICDILRKNLDHDDVVYVFGSRVKDKAREYSDLDLAIVSNVDLIKLKEMFSESDLPYFVDVLDYNNIPDYMKKEIDDYKIELEYK